MKDYKILSSFKPIHTPLQSRTNPPHRILVVDEDSDLRRLYADTLTSLGYYVHAAQDGAAGWEALQSNSYDLLITENDLSRLTGIELVKQLRAARMTVPVVMAAARLPTYELARNPSLLLAALLEKPFEVDVLLEMVKAVLGPTDGPLSQIVPRSSRQNQPFANGLRLR